MAEPKPLKPTLSKPQFFTALAVVLVIGLGVFFMMRAMKPPPPTACESSAQREENLARKWWSAGKFAEAKRKGYWKNRCPERKEERPWWAFWKKSDEEIDEEIRVEKLRASNPSFFVCKDGWKGGNGLEYLQEAIIRNCLNVVPGDVIEKSDKSFLWSVKREHVMFNNLAKNKDLDFFKKQVKALTFEELIKPIEYAEDEETFFFTSLTYYARHSQEGFNLVKNLPLKDVPYDVWIDYRGPQDFSAIENVMSFRKFWEYVFNHKQWIGQAEKMEAVAKKARIAVSPIPKGLEDYLDAQIKLARQS